MGLSSNILPFVPRARPRASAADNLGQCPACARAVYADGHAIRLHGAFFHADCALYRREDRLRSR